MPSTIALIVSGKIPELFFKELTKKEIFTGRTKIDMTKEIDEAVKEYIREKNGIFLFICCAFYLERNSIDNIQLNWIRSVIIELHCIFSNAFYLLGIEIAVENFRKFRQQNFIPRNNWRTAQLYLKIKTIFDFTVSSNWCRHVKFIWDTVYYKLILI